MNIAPCQICNKNKKDVSLKKLDSKFFAMCKNCELELKWTTKCLEIGTDWLIEKFPEKYAKFSKIAVTPLNI